MTVVTEEECEGIWDENRLLRKCHYCNDDVIIAETTYHLTEGFKKRMELSDEEDCVCGTCSATIHRRV